MVVTGPTDVSSAEHLLGLRVTEKVTFLSERSNAYTFNIGPSATKRTVAEAVRRLYNVVPKKIRIVRIPRKRVFVRGTWGTKSGGRKAYVYLKSGDKISIA